jgi:tetratricopeptide (TPR) repeat protein/predicted Ser/Thr protein kinase
VLPHDDVLTEPASGDWSADIDGVALGVRMGRYELLTVVGAGGMGVVFEARDPDLDRRVAVKVLRRGDDAAGNGAARLRREGQTMARIAHPNVVRVYDVGVSHGHAFVAMEYVAGGTLARWLAGSAPTPARIVAMFVEAGRGLVALHDAGLVHRDFKPSNVLITTDGRPVVTDFGLARSAADWGAGAGADAGLAAGSGPSGRANATAPPFASVTRTGHHAGTPEYMAPEQHGTAPVDGRADQFSFCVALWRALYAAAPYDGGTTLGEPRIRPIAGALVPPPAGAAASRVPPHVQRALERGLQLDPERRFPTMTALLAALDPPPAPRRGAVAAGAGALVVAAALATWAATRTGGGGGEPVACPAPTAGADALWGPARRDAVRGRLAAIDPLAGPRRYAAVDAVLSRGVPAWTRHHVEACRDTRVEHSQPEPIFEARLRCLDRWATRAGDLVTGLVEAPDLRAQVEEVAAVSALPSLERCMDPRAQAAALQFPTDEAAHAEAVAILAEVAAIDRERAAGRIAGLARRAAGNTARARALANPGTLAKALGIEARVAQALGDFGRAIEIFRELTQVAADADDDYEAAVAWILMGRLTAVSGNPQGAEVMLTAARAFVTRLGDPPELTTELIGTEGDLALYAGDYDRARAKLLEALELLDRHGAAAPGSPLAATRVGTLIALASVHGYEGHPEAALEHGLAARAAAEQVFGPGSFHVISLDIDLAYTLYDLARPADAEVRARAAATSREAMLGDSPETATALSTLARMIGAQDRLDEALPIAERAAAIAAASMPAADPNRLAIDGALADLYAAAGRLTDALAIYVRLAEAVEAAGARPTSLAAIHVNRANLERLLDRCAEAVRDYQRAAAAARAIDPESAEVADALRGEAECLYRLRRPADAIARLELALALPSLPHLAEDVAFAKALLGMLLVDTRRDRARGLALARAAQAELTALATDLPDAVDLDDPRRARLAAWLERRDRAPRE